MRKSQFTVDLTQAIKAAEDKVETVVKASAFQLFRAIVLKTPVDTGHLAYNWQVSINKPKLEELEGVDPDKSGTISRGEGEVAKWTLTDRSIWITNNVDYALKIEYYGSKIKAPQGMVRISLREFNQMFKGSAMTGNRFR